MPPTRRRLLLAAASAGTAFLAGCAGRLPRLDRQPRADPTTDGPTTPNPAVDDATQLPTTTPGVTVTVRNGDDESHDVRVTGVDADEDDEPVALGPGEAHEVGVLDPPEDGEISYSVVVWVDGERAADRRVAVRRDSDLAAVTAHLRGGWVSWSETHTGPAPGDAA
ncbi:hypothetical protein [Halobacterium wangiae]|uniref:hypothetical protein n=1 Tax=Halobacterium wangiae TaxID=2902623 RepID=UPI001E28C96C|nr:hypothetical protein [Halobacterium wangiae]